jgi:nucleotide-binding universal stress UspA family protein
MINRVLLAVDDSPAALAAVRAALDVASACGAELRAVTVVADHDVSELLRAGADPLLVHARRKHAADSVLRHAAGAARHRSVAVQTAALEGEPAPAILGEARGWHADLVVVGRASPSGPGEPYIGGQTRQVLEYAEVPVLVVPPDRH